MKKTVYLILLLCSVLFCVTSVFAQEPDSMPRYYVSELGSDENPGTEELPFKTIACAVKNLGHSDGTVVICGEGFWDGVPAHTGKIVFEGLSAEAVSEQIIDFSEKNDSSSNKGCLHLGGDSVFKNITFRAHGDKHIFTDGHDIFLEGKIGYVNETDEDEKLEICIGSFGSECEGSFAVLSAQCEIKSVSVGHNAMSKVTGKTSVKICGSDVESVYICGNGAEIEDLELIISSGTLGTLETKRAYKARSKISGSVFVISNNGLGVPFENNAGISASGGVHYIECSSGTGIQKVTDSDVLYKVTEGKTLVAENTETGKLCYSSVGGHIALPAGSYKITSSDTDYFTNDGSTVTVLSPVALDYGESLYTSPAHEKTVFLGWVYKNTGIGPSDGELLPAGTVLEAKYETVSEDEFGISGVRIKSGGICFVGNMTATFGGKISPSDFGITVFPQKLLAGDRLVKNGSYTRDGVTYYSKSKEDSNGDGKVTFTLEGIDAENYHENYCAVAYAEYTTANGQKHTLYSDMYTSGIADVLKNRKAENDKDKEVFEMLYNEWKEKYFGAGTTPIKSAAYEHAFAVNDTGMQIKEITLGTGEADDEVVIAMLTDTHLHTTSPKARETLERSMKYASFADKIVLCGDNIEAVSSDEDVELLRKTVWEPYPGTICVIGNHDMFYGDSAQLRAKVQNIWPHNPWYYSELVGERVLVVSIEDGESVFTDEQCDAFEKDLKLARENGYTVLFFHHISIRNIDKSKGANERMYEIVKNNHDVIAACFSGHNHVDEYREIDASYENADGEKVEVKIPCYKLESNNGDPDDVDYTGNILFIRVR